MRILMLTWHYPPAVGGSERMAERLVGALAPRGHSLEIWTARRSDAPSVESPAPNVVIRRFLYGVPVGPLFGATAFLQAAWRLWRARGRFDVIHSHQASWGSLGGVAARRFGGTPILVMVASSGPLNDVTVMRRRKGGGLLVRLLRQADRFVALCRSARSEMALCGIDPDRIEIVHNGLDLSQFGEEEGVEAFKGGKGAKSEDAGEGEIAGGERHSPTVVYVGRLHPIKGVDLLIRAFAQVAEQKPGARLIVVGDGPAKPDLEALAAQLGLDIGSEEPVEGAKRTAGTPPPANASPPDKHPDLPDRSDKSDKSDTSDRADGSTGPATQDGPGAKAQVIFAGLHTDPRPFYRRADVVVLPSRTEGMSNVMIEAMASARPIVATAVGGNCDLLDPSDRRPAAPEAERSGVFPGENGVLVPPQDPETLARGILSILDDPARARTMAASARRYAQAHCAIQAVADAYETIYRELADTGAGRN